MPLTSKKDFHSTALMKQLNIAYFKNGIHLSFWGAEVALLGGFLGVGLAKRAWGE